LENVTIVVAGTRSAGRVGDFVMLAAVNDSSRPNLAQRRWEQPFVTNSRSNYSTAQGNIVAERIEAPSWWTRKIVPSIVAYSKSESPDKVLNRLSKTPSVAQRRKRRNTEFQFPNSEGGSRRGAPVRGNPERGFDKASIVLAMPTGIAGLARNEKSSPLPSRRAGRRYWA
jgi:hypothetical protein